MVAAILILSWVSILALAFLLLGVLRSVRRLQWRLDQLEATTPRRIGREGVPVGKIAPPLELPDLAGQAVSLAQFRGQQVLLAFMQAGCGPCEEIIPRLNRLLKSSQFAVLAIVHGKHQDVHDWSREVQPQFPVLVQESWDISKRFEVFATPFAFVLDHNGKVLAKGIINSADYLDLLLADAEDRLPGKHRSSANELRPSEVHEGTAAVSSA